MFDAWLTLGLTGLMLVALVRDWGPPDAVILGTTILLAGFRVISPEQAFSGFANPGVLTVGALFVVAAALRETGTLDYVGHRFLGRVQTERGALFWLASLVAPTSAFINNTPIVAMLVPVVLDWCRKRSVAPSKLLIPLSYLAILGGVCTLIGTSTNLVVHGLLLREGMPGIGLFEIGKVGLAFAVVGILYLLLVGHRLLPERKELLEQLGASRREYLVEMVVQPGCRLVGQSVEAAGLRHLPGLFLIEVDRAGTVIAPVSPEEVILAHDRLVFTGVVSTIVDLERIPGLVPAADTAYEFSPQRQRGRRLCEVVVSPSSPLVGKTIRSANFRALYDAAVVAVHRNGARLTRKLGDVILRPGDTLLLQVGRRFSEMHRNNPDFYLVSDVEGSRPYRHDRAGVAIALFAGMILMVIMDWATTETAAFLIAGLMIATRCISIADARQALEIQVLIAIAGAFGVGAALSASGAAAAIVTKLVALAQTLGPQFGPLAALAVLYLATLIVTELITNNAAAVLMFPFCLQTAVLLGVSPRPFILALALAASAAFASPVGYQTHMMVYGPGGYRFTDFVRVGLPLNLILWLVAVVLVPYFWPFLK